MNSLFRDFLVWSVGFAVVSVTAILVVHLFARKRRQETPTENEGEAEHLTHTRRPLWCSTLVVLAAYLFLLGPVLQSIGRTFHSETMPTSSAIAPLQSSINPLAAPGSAGHRGSGQSIVNERSNSDDCPCRQQQVDKKTSPESEADAELTGRVSQ